jgi:hypothetical protein
LGIYPSIYFNLDIYPSNLKIRYPSKCQNLGYLSKLPKLLLSS